MPELGKEDLKGFKKYGVVFNGTSGSNVYGDCPFCSKHNKFYASVKSLMWDCKSCGKKGNYETFLACAHKECVERIDKDDIKKLSKDRGLPISSFKDWEIGWTGSHFLLPVRNEQGKIQDLRNYRIGKRKLIGTPKCSIGIFGMDKLARSSHALPVYLCEGEWDAIAMNWLVKKNKINAVVVGAPGANTFKKEWAPIFKGRDVIIMYDNDEAGENGQVLVRNRLQGVARSVQFLNWINKFPTGYDIRDIVSEVGVRDKKPKKCMRVVKQMVESNAKKKFSPLSPQEEREQEQPQNIDKSITLKKVYDTFKKWMFITNTDPIQICLATVLSNILDGDPVWMLLVAPPGGAKTEIISSLDLSSEVYTTSSLTSHALISGAKSYNGIEPSIIPKLDGKVLVVKDFTTILSMRENEKDEIFGILRDAYDGKCGKVFGTGDHKYFESHFSMLCGVTPSIYEIGSKYAGLGERYLKFFIGDNLEHENEEDIIRKAISNVSKEKKMRVELSECVNSFIAVMCEKVRDSDFVLPEILESYTDRFISLAQWGSRMRGTVSRERYNTEMITSKPSAEVGSRLGKNLAKIGIALAMVNGRDKVVEKDFEVVRKIVLDTVSQRNEDILRILYKSCPDMDSSLKTRDVSIRTRYPLSTATRVLNDMNLLNIVSRVGSSNKHEWTVSKYMRNLIKKTGLYSTEKELNRPLKSARKIILRKKK